MWIKRSVARSPSAPRPGSCVGHRVWILLAMTHLTLDFSVCSPLGQGLGIKLTPKSVPRSRPRLQHLWDTPNKLHWRTASPLAARRLLNPVPPPQDNRAGVGLKVKGQKQRKPAHKGQAACKECRLRYSQMETGDPLAVIAEAPAASSSGSRGDTVRLLLRARRQLKWDSYDKSQEGRTTTVAGFIDWGPTGTDSVDGDDKPEPNVTLFTRVSTTTVATTTSTTARPSQRTFTVVTTPEPKRPSTTKAPISSETVKPQKPYVDTPGLAVHQIITITVSLIMVIAALITTLVLKNCCAQSGNGRHNSHQRKIHQQEESCQNLTDFTPARVPSKVDIFTAYNDSLQCSHECVRTAVPIYTDEMIQQTPVYKTAYNGNRPSPTERQLIPVAFVSEKWFEISC
ncbi:adherens junction-associated protein 1 [Seriola lalandi dorsalis]|uniref:Adherens junctions associated protein 1 n=2 Tax=Seriola TaxID=8160 RepID=A0A3B4UPL2_SERDU|nr:adherens junction-associated protein 1 [Seriola dumerili]XP_023263598.1 adherens junction-associated protein 1 [Seriola lalandi dorsalis]XP_056241788.1 adherens junction-associated protein 1 [Seriola aureovittata]